MISFVYFDVGGVAMKDFSGSNKWDTLMETICIEEKDKKHFLTFWEKYDPELCLDRKVDTLIPLIQKEFACSIPSDFSFYTYFLDHFEQNRAIWPIIDEIKKHCRIGLLTNMYPGMLDEIKRRKLLPRIEWDVIIDSSIEGCLKPHTSIYKVATLKAEKPKEEILFIDNTIGHVEGAKKFGLQAFHYNSFNYEESNAKLISFFRISK
jgi:FMN phosphatase YigB (HAD superfamily)